jgi:hypothetical protein
VVEDDDLSICLLELAAEALDLIVLVWQLYDEVVCFSDRWAMRVRGSSHLIYIGPMTMRALIHPSDHPALDSAVEFCLFGNRIVASLTEIIHSGGIEALRQRDTFAVAAL